MPTTGLTLTLYDLQGRQITDFQDPEALQFSSKLPGGCDKLTCSLAGAWVDRQDEYDRNAIRSCQLADSSGTVIWAGFDPILTHNLNTLDLEFSGYWYSLADDLFGHPGTSYTDPTYVYTVLRDIVAGAAPLLSNSTAYIQTGNTTNLVPGSDPLKFTALDSPMTVITRLLGVPDSSLNQWFAAVWTDKKLRYFPRATTPTLACSLDNLDPGWSFTVDWSDVWSGVQIKYTDLAGTDSVSGVYHEADTARRLGRSRTFPLDLTGRGYYDIAAIDQIANLFLQEHNGPKQRTSGFTVRQPFVMDARFNPYPAHLIRAGDVIRVVDLPVAADAWDGTLDDKRSFHLVQVQHDAALGTTQLTPDYAPPRVDNLIARLMRSAIAPAVVMP